MRRNICLIMSIFGFSLLLSACATPTSQYPGDPSGFFPDLTDPPGAFRPGGGGGGGAEKRGMSFELVADLSIEDVSQHYTDQLEAAGWVQLSRSEDEDGISTYWELQDENGKVWPVILQISRDIVSEQADYKVELRAINPP